MSELIFLESKVKMPLMHLPVRSVMVTVGVYRLLISPGSRLTEEQLKSLGEVTDIIVPNLFHSAGVPLAKKVFPKARLWAPDGIKTKPMPKHLKIKWDFIFEKNPWFFAPELELIPIRGMPGVMEYVFVHTSSRSLIVCDLCFNMIEENSLGAKLILRIFGTYKKFGISRFFLSFVKDRLVFEESLRKVMNFQFDKIIVSHGVIVEQNAKQILLSALQAKGYLN